MTKIGITGASGFIGKSLMSHFYEMPGVEVEVIKLPVNHQLDYDLVFHCAGVNRPNDDETFDTNFQLTENLCNWVRADSHVVYMSSIQVLSDNLYGISKLAAERIVKKRTNWSILRLPNVFGAGCKPNYNSVVATFCAQTASAQEHSIKDPDHLLELLWIQDLVSFCEHFLLHSAGKNLYEFNHLVERITVGNLSKMIVQINEDLGTGYVQTIEHTFRWKLETTLLSYFESPLLRVVQPIIDDRGLFCELLKTKNGQISYLRCDVGEERGLHFHRAKFERFFVLNGQGLLRSKNLYGQITEFEMRDSEVIEGITIPYHTHSIRNTGDKELVVLIWANEVFDPEKPDTFKRDL